MQEKVVIKVEYHIPEIEKVLPEEQLEFILGEGDVVQGKYILGETYGIVKIHLYYIKEMRWW